MSSSSSSTAAANQPSQDDWIRVTSRDGFSFIVKRSVVFRSGTLRNMLDERRTSPCLHLLCSPRRDVFSLPPSPADSFAEAVQKVCPVDERCLILFFFTSKPFLPLRFSSSPMYHSGLPSRRNSWNSSPSRQPTRKSHPTRTSPTSPSASPPKSLWNCACVIVPFLSFLSSPKLIHGRFSQKHCLLHARTHARI